MKIRIERLEIEAPDLLKEFFENEARADSAFEQRKNTFQGQVVQIAAHVLQKALDHLFTPHDPNDDLPPPPAPPAEYKPRKPAPPYDPAATSSSEGQEPE